MVSLAMTVLAERLLKDSSKVCHQSLVGFDPSIVGQIGRFLVRLLLVKLSRSVRSPFVGFISVVDKSFVRRR